MLVGPNQAEELGDGKKAHIKVRPWPEESLDRVPAAGRREDGLVRSFVRSFEGGSRFLLLLSTGTSPRSVLFASSSKTKNRRAQKDFDFLPNRQLCGHPLPSRRISQGVGHPERALRGTGPQKEEMFD